MKYYVFLVIPIFFSACTSKPAKDKPYPNQVVMLSMDGFRWDYPEMYDTPNLDKLQSTGVRARAIIPVFPSKTFPNHYSMATGLVPDNHGLVNNTFVDPLRKDTFKIGDRSKVEDGYYFGGEPIWVTAGKNGLKTASFFWVGSEADVQGIRPDTWKRFDASVPFTDRIDSVVSWLALPREKSPDLITWYFEEPDGVGHDFGPFGKETGVMVHHLDSLVGIFLDKVEKLGKAEEINIIVTSDHGMGEIHGDKWINIHDYIQPHWIEYLIGYNPMLFLQPAENYEDSILLSLSALNHIKAYRKEEIPARLNYGKNERISDLIVLADSAWSIGRKPSNGSTIGGAHGYDPDNSDMHAIFYATGPDFKKAYQHPAFYNIDLYPLICHLLGVQGADTDGKSERIEGMLK